MPQIERRLTQTLIRLPAARVNRLVTVTGGEALEQFVRARWGRKEGGIRGLARVVGTSPDTIYHWFNGSALNTDDLDALARALGVRRFEIVAAMDGEDVVMPLNDQTRTAFLSLMEEWADSRGLPRPRPGSERGTGAA